MSLTPSNILPLGTPAPEFNLLDTVSGEFKTLHQLKSDVATVILFICNHCPYVVHINEKLVELANKYKVQGVQFIAISSNDITTHPQDGPEQMAEHARQQGYCFPYLYDETQEVAKAYQAACTPDLYVFTCALKCIYHGQFDDSRPNSDTAVTGKDLAHALDLALVGQHIPQREQHPSRGCNIKWKS